MNVAQLMSTRPSKGEETRAQILEAAVQMAAVSGFESLTIGTLAEKTGMSKSGLFAHFGSKLDLQIAALDEAARRFTEAVYQPALKAPRGLKRLRALFENWIEWPTQLGGGCPIDSAMREYDHKPGPMREAVLERQRLMDRELVKTVQMAVDSGELAAKTDVRQLEFEIVAIVLASFRGEALFGPDESRRRARAAFDRVIQEHRA